MRIPLSQTQGCAGRNRQGGLPLIFYQAENYVYDTVGVGLHGYIPYRLVNIAFGFADKVVSADTQPTGFIDCEPGIECLGFQDSERY